MADASKSAAPNPFASFGASQPPASSPFGAPATTPAFGAAPSSGTPFGASAAAPATSTGGGAFGSSTGGSLFGTRPTLAGATGFGQQSTTGGAFGQPAGGGVAGGAFGQPATGSLFGQQPAAGGNAFGQQQQQQQPAASTGGPFGQSTAFGASQPGGLFGSTAPTSTSLFGSSSTNQQQQPAASPFGSSVLTTTGGPFGSFGQQKQAGFGQVTGPSVLGQSMSGPQAGPMAGGLTLQKGTRFNDLPPEAKKVIEEIDLYIQEETLVGEELRVRDFGPVIKDGRTRLRDLCSDMATLTSQVSQTSSSLVSLRHTLDLLTLSLLRSGTIVDSAKNPQDRDLAARAARFGRFPFEWFEERCSELERRLARVRKGSDEVAGLLRGYGDRGNPAAIVPALKSQHATFMHLASTVAVLDGHLSALKDDFRVLWRRQMGGATARDPFEEAVLVESGIGGGMAGMRL